MPLLGVLAIRFAKTVGAQELFAGVLNVVATSRIASLRCRCAAEETAPLAPKKRPRSPSSKIWRS